MSEISVDTRTVSHTDGPERSSGGGKLVRWFAVLFLIFLVLGVYAVLQRRSEHQVLAQQTERLSVPYVSVIHVTPVEGDSEMVLPGDLKAFMESPIYARTNGYLKKWY